MSRLGNEKQRGRHGVVMGGVALKRGGGGVELEEGKAVSALKRGKAMSSSSLKMGRAHCILGHCEHKRPIPSFSLCSGHCEHKRPIRSFSLCSAHCILGHCEHKRPIRSFSFCSEFLEFQARKMQADRIVRDNYFFIESICDYEDYRSPIIGKLTRRLQRDMLDIFNCNNGVPFLLPSKGDVDVYETALANTLSPGDKIISFLMGQQSAQWVHVQRGQGYIVDVIESEWGRGPDFDALASKLREDSAGTIAAICIVHNEESTGVTSDLEKLRRVLDEEHHKALLIVDGATSISCIDFRMEAWGVDVAFTLGRKAFRSRNGIDFMCASTRALQASKTARSFRPFDWRKHREAYNVGGFWPYAPPIPVLKEVSIIISRIICEGVENAITRHARVGNAIREAVKAWGLTVFAQAGEWCSNTVTAVVVPQNINPADIIHRARDDHQIWLLGPGRDKLVGNVFTIEHYSDFYEETLFPRLNAIEAVLIGMGCPIQKYSGVDAASTYFDKIGFLFPRPRAPSRIL